MSEKTLLNRRQWLRPVSSKMGSGHSFVHTELSVSEWGNLDGEPSIEYCGTLTLGSCSKILDYDFYIRNKKEQKQAIAMLDKLETEIQILKAKIEVQHIG